MWPINHLPSLSTLISKHYTQNLTLVLYIIQVPKLGRPPVLAGSLFGPLGGQLAKVEKVAALAAVLLALEVAQAELGAEAGAGVGAVDGGLAEDLVPRILHDAAAELVGQIRLPEPLAVGLVLVEGAVEEALARRGELGAAVRPHRLRDRLAREQLRVGPRVRRLRLEPLVGPRVVPPRRRVQVRLHLERAAQQPGAPQRREPVAQDVGDPESLQDGDAVCEKKEGV